MMNSIVILFCLFMAIIGFAVVFIPRNKKKSNIKIGFIYSSIFLILALYMSYLTFFKRVEWTTNEKGVLVSKCSFFEKANLFVLEQNVINLFLTNENKLIEKYSTNNEKCVKQKISLSQKKFCGHVLRSVEDDLNYGVLVISSKNLNYIYVIDSGEIYDWCFKCYK